ncbi:Guanine nucleotide exchange factor LTE1 [Ceratobasidium sp. AG-Ba]|nr:Guanine nucleotide exchange factor LTE1 [Ceratobasidium sp. AG-Ba]
MKGSPSHLADNGYVYWKDATLSDHSIDLGQPICRSFAKYSVSFSEIRWGSIRATEGWAGLQHHALLRTTIRIDPPELPSVFDNGEPTYLTIAANQVSHIAIFDSESSDSTLHWQTGNIYAYSDAPRIHVPLVYNNQHVGRPDFEKRGSATDSITLVPGEAKHLDVLVGLDYEIRLFRDPLVFANTTAPAIEADLHMEIEHFTSFHRHNGTLEIHSIDKKLPLSSNGLGAVDACMLVGDSASHIVPHFVDGWAYGDMIGAEVVSCSREALVIDQASFVIAQTTHGLPVLSIIDFKPVVLAASQTRIVSLKIAQENPVEAGLGSLIVTLRIRPHVSETETLFYQINATIPFVNHESIDHPEPQERGIHLTYASVTNTPASAVVLPPKTMDPIVNSGTRILLALHGAGVMHTNPAWISTLPRPPKTWVLVVHGLTPWGMDWREASRADACSALRALVLKITDFWNEEDYCAAHDSVKSIVLAKSKQQTRVPVIIIGHSNGGQGTLFLSSQFPDSFPALIPAAGYTSARLYVSVQHSRASLFSDAALQAIMKASLQGQDGDIIAGNLVFSRVHLVHGGDDENVPVWHSRERMALIKAWDPDSDVRFTEVPGKPHIWPTIFKDEPVASRIDELVAFPYGISLSALKPFTYTVVWPSEAGSMRGWRIRELSVPGRLAKLSVNQNRVRTTNVYGLSVNTQRAGINSRLVIIDNQQINLPSSPTIWLRRGSGQWEVVDPYSPYPSGPLSHILNSPEPISIVIPSVNNAHYHSVARRLAHNLYTYLKLDCVVVKDDEALEQAHPRGSVVVIGGSRNRYGIKVRSSPLQVHPDGSISISGFKYNQAGTCALSLHKNHLYMDAVDESGYERALLAFPLRTGVPGPEWMILGEECDRKGYAGVYAAGFWDRHGEFSEIMSYFN